jgi:hypothetical protein
MKDRALTSSLFARAPEKAFSLAMLVPGLIMISIGLSVSYTELGLSLASFFGGHDEVSS